MRRHIATLALVALMILGSTPGSTRAQGTDLDQGVYVDQLTGFGVTWDPGIFTGTLADIGGIQLAGLGSTGTLSMTSAPTAAECLARFQDADPLGEPDWEDVPTTPTLPEGSTSELGMRDGVVFRACIADPANPAGATFIVLSLTGPGPKAEWDAAIAAWQSVIDAMTFPDPALLTSTGINGDTYTDPVFGWSVVFDPARYEAQYAAGTADTPFLSGLYLYSEASSESGGIWAERHESAEACLEAQQAVNAGLPGFGEAGDVASPAPAESAMTSKTWEFTLEPDGRFLVFAGCQPLLDGQESVEGVYLVATFTVPEGGYDSALGAWTTLLQALTFRTGAPNGTPASQ